LMCCLLVDQAVQVWVFEKAGVGLICVQPTLVDPAAARDVEMTKFFAWFTQ
jgi:hypothetical protein